jgi:dihydroorotate dehydrogenase electron transfer subunit
MIVKELMKVLSHKELAPAIFELVLQGQLVQEMQEPGQFVHVKTSDSNDPLLRRPISICSINHNENSFTMIYRTEGKGTKLLSLKKETETVDVLGPLGHGFPVDAVASGETALLVGGGIGVPPLYELSKRLVSKGVQVIHVLGFETKSAVFYEAEFAKLGETYITTVDGSHGTKGFVTDVMKDLTSPYKAIYSCGPTPMLKALEAGYSDHELYLSLEERMGCGIGACFACVCHTTGEDATYKKICSDGPVFRAGEVIL